MASHECRNLLDAVRRNNLDLVREFLNRGELVTQRNINEETVLHLAARGGSKQIVKLLLEWGADVNAVNDAGWTPLYSAVYIGHCAVAEMLIGKNPAVLRSHGGEETPGVWKFPPR